ncbi:MAG TPA: hypothetical protein DDW52_08940 [Planctomycetaceae bacterium]|nr:hypothetical protein [Planctomycetaceae bacterium]
MNEPQATGSRLSDFIRSLTTGGVIPIDIGPHIKASPDDMETASAILREAEALARLSAPADAPELKLSVALWAAQVMHHYCRVLIDRTNSKTTLPDEIRPPRSLGTSAGEHWSADIVFRSWWDLVRRARKLSPDDSLNGALSEITRQWPLAAVGTQTVCRSERIDVVWKHPCLRQILIDRIIHRQDRELVSSERIASAVKHIELLSGGTIPTETN